MPNEPSPLTRFFGYAMMAVGVLITLLSGACTLYFVTMSLQPPGNRQFIVVCLLVGAPFIFGGLGLIFGGRSLSRRQGSKVPPEDVF